MKSDEQLLRAYSKGKHKAFEKLVLRHGASIKGYALRMMRNPQAAEEIYSETFERLARQKGQWAPGGSVRSYLFTIAHNCCIDRLRKEQRARAAHAEVVALEAARTLQPSPEAMAALGETASFLEDAIAELPEEHRQVLLLRTVHGLSGKESAQVLGMEEGQVRSKLSYARKRLRALLAQRMRKASRATGGSP